MENNMITDEGAKPNGKTSEQQLKDRITKLVTAMKRVLVISDRKHVAWDAAWALLDTYSCPDCGEEISTVHVCLDPLVAATYIRDLRDMNAKNNERIKRLESALSPWVTGGIINGTIMAWIAAKDPKIAKSIVYARDAVDFAMKGDPE
jgi:uncharacterized protein (UPF0212 family)